MEPPMPYPFRYHLRVRYAETDAQGIVFYGNYLIYLDTAIFEYLRNLDFKLQTHITDTGNDFHVVSASVDYQAPARFEDDLVVEISVDHIGRSSLVFKGVVYFQKDQSQIATGKIVWVNVHQQSHTAVPLPADLVERIEAYQVEDI